MIVVLNLVTIVTIPLIGFAWFKCGQLRERANFHQRSAAFWGGISAIARDEGRAPNANDFLVAWAEHIDPTMHAGRLR